MHKKLVQETMAAQLFSGIALQTQALAHQHLS